jgi:hypothetical protein
MTEATNASIKKGRLIMLAILAVFILPFFILPLLMSPENLQKTNKGTLIQPHVQFADLQVSDLNDHPVSVVPGKKWTMLYVVPASCDSVCSAARTNALYSMRQVRISLQHDMERVQSVLLLTAAPDQEFSAMLQNQFPTMVQMHVPRETVDKYMAGSSSAGNIYLMSPDGYIFMYYPPQAIEKESLVHANDIRSDLKKSIKGSRN